MRCRVVNGVMDLHLEVSVQSEVWLEESRVLGVVHGLDAEGGREDVLEAVFGAVGEDGVEGPGFVACDDGAGGLEGGHVVDA